MDKNSIIFNSQDITFKTPFGAVPTESEITISIYTLSSIEFDSVIFNLFEENKNSIATPKKISFPMKKMETVIYENKVYNRWILTFLTPNYTTLLFYHFELKIKKETIFYGNNIEHLGGVGSFYNSSPLNYQITLFYKNKTIPRWFKEGIGYQIFPDRFFNGNEDKTINSPKKNSFLYGDWYDKPMYIKNEKGAICRWEFFGGNLKGIEKKIPYLKEFKIDFVYLNPIFEATSNHRYDTVDYLKIDPMLGEFSDFSSLIKTGKKEGINFILDGVFNHTGKDSYYFKDAISSIDSPFYSWYRFSKYPTEYDCWWGIKDLPCTNELEPSFLNFIIKDKNSVVSHWMKTGIKGWRLDVADELPGYFIESMKYKIKDYDSESVLIGEVWEDASNKISYNQRREYFNGLQLDSVMNYPLREYLIEFFSFHIDSFKLIRFLNSLKENYPTENFNSLFNLLGSHDTPRIKTIIKKIVADYSAKNEDRENFVTKTLIALSTLQFTLPGVPVIYYGDEVGLEGEKDPDNRRTYPWQKEDLTLLEHYKKICELRKNYEVFKKGKTDFFAYSTDLFYFFRELNENEYALILCNRSSRKSISIDLSKIIKEGPLFLWNKNSPYNDKFIEVPPLTSYVLIRL